MRGLLEIQLESEANDLEYVCDCDDSNWFRVFSHEDSMSSCSDEFLNDSSQGSIWLLEFRTGFQAMFLL